MQSPTIVPIPAFKDNYLWLLVRGRDAVVVDPGDAAPVEAALAQRSLRLRAILLTHHHRDHTGGVAQLVAARDHDLPVYGPAREAIEGVTTRLSDGDTVELPCLGLSFDVIDVPGHTSGHIAYFAEGRSVDGDPRTDGERPPLLFCGDTLFAGGCGRLFEGTPQQMHASLARLAALPPDTCVYCAHEYTRANLRFARAVEPANLPLELRERDVVRMRDRDQPTVPTTIGLERSTNPFLRSDEATVRAAAERHTPGAGASSLATFAALRRWKDSF